jgi:hypothetical protein
VWRRLRCERESTSAAFGVQSPTEAAATGQESGSGVSLTEAEGVAPLSIPSWQQGMFVVMAEKRRKFTAAEFVRGPYAS